MRVLMSLGSVHVLDKGLGILHALAWNSVHIRRFPKELLYNLAEFRMFTHH